MKKFSILIIALLTLITNDTFAGNEDRIGSAGASQLLINPWSRSSGLAGSNIASIRGIQGSFLNPAGMAFTRQTEVLFSNCLLYTSPSPRDRQKSRMPSSA